ncbi:MAG: hypothetical protein NPINA01_27080 [Nitrospinaceae bacterium]|nr:MAG: hypothetical protein NPINA01_27080 [Nitrospinaceae bacterium]
MRIKKTPFIIAMTSSFLLAGMFGSASIAATSNVHVSGADTKMPSIGTDSKGSYSYDQEKLEASKSDSETPHGLTSAKDEGSKSKTYSHKSHGMVHGKKEGSGSKKYSGSRHGYKHHKKEGSGSKKYSDYRHGSQHYKKEGSGGHKYSHGAPYKGKHGYSSGGHGTSGYKRTHGKDPFKHVLCFREKLGLTDEQVEQIKTKEFEYKKLKIQTKADHAIAHMELDRLVHAENIDEAKIRSLADRISEIKSRKIHATIEAKIAVLNILTSEQRKKVHEKHSSH